MTSEHDQEAWTQHRARTGGAQHAMRTQRLRAARLWTSAIAILDKTEGEVRDLIERGLAHVAALSGVKYHEAIGAASKVIAQIGVIRSRAIKRAFRAIRDGGVTEIEGTPLAKWAHYFSQTDQERIDNAIRSGLIAGLDNTEIARKVIGSLELTGVDGVTEITRQQITRLGRVAVFPRKPKK